MIKTFFSFLKLLQLRKRKDKIRKQINPAIFIQYGCNGKDNKNARKTLQRTYEYLSQNARNLGQIFRSEINKFIETSSLVNLVRGKGLLNAIVINDIEESETAWNICLKLKENGLLAKPTHGNIIRFAPPLTIVKSEMNQAINIIIDSITGFE